MSTAAARKAPVGDQVSKVNEEIAVGEDLGFQRSWWTFERLVWMVFVVIIALDLAGLFGRGPLAHATIASADQSLRVRYERIQRTGTPSILTAEFDGSAIQHGQIELFVSDALVSGLGAQRIIPQPISTRVGGGGLLYTFPVASPPAIVRFELQPPGPGLFRFTLTAGLGNSVTGKTWVVP